MRGDIMVGPIRFLLAIFGLLGVVEAFPDILQFRLSKDGRDGLIFAAACFILIWLLTMLRKRYDDAQEREFAATLQRSKECNPSAILDFLVRASRSRRLIIDERCVRLGSSSLKICDIKSVLFCNKEFYINGLGNYWRDITLSDGRHKIKIRCASNFGGEKLGELTYKAVADAVWLSVIPDLLKRWRVNIQNGEKIQVGCVSLSREGVTVRKFFDRYGQTISWVHVVATVENQKLKISDSHSKASAVVDLNETENAMVLLAFLRRTSKRSERV